MSTEGIIVNFNLIQHLRSAFQSATIGIVRTKGDDMARKQAAKTKVKEADPLGDLMTAEFIERSFKEAVADVRQSLKEEGLDCYSTVDGKRAAKKPDGRIVLTPEKKN
jgi:hypothetical protein